MPTLSLSPQEFTFSGTENYVFSFAFYAVILSGANAENEIF